MTVQCSHLKTKRGKNAPRQWGSFRTEVCTKCGAFRFKTHLDEIRSEWKPKSEYPDATAEQELE